MTHENPESRMARVHATHAAPLLRFLLSLTRNERHTAEDLVQETMVRAWQHLDALPVEEENARRWLFTVARRIAIDAARMRQVRPAEVSLLEAIDLATEDQTTNNALANHSMQEAFTALTDSHRTILAELYLRGASADEAAARLGVPVGTVKSRAYYALRSLRSALDEAA
ncbi:sigma-70 family RNA polymerase sigma factor [Actinoplanes sp. NBRC 103695]|uniref:sigma-70 family RNA polymerase sigma factor n=1 Tax=Actinoplanes sp. NBRC 103695 TaxID=3032202 RepID=UPI0024A2D75A|nr:sigma-70 family RNA polymerase sigma factor [Actinoplanes sp. NBRC 103695]GLY93141.1 RNA polymerase sigma factor SigL [Actinoplanes sp. NBRC 103695]